MSQVPRVVLVVLDGFGERPEKEGNAVRLARMPTFAIGGADGLPAALSARANFGCRSPR